MSKPMGILKRKEVPDQQAATPGPDTFVKLIAHDGRAARYDKADSGAEGDR